MNRFIAIDEEGYFLSGGVRATDEEYGRELLKNLILEHRALVTYYQGQKVIVESFDSPLVVRTVTPNKLSSNWILNMPYGFAAEADLKTLTVDEWDRFQGKTKNGIGFVLSRPAQMQLFNLADEFDDDSITINGTKIVVRSLNEVDQFGPSKKEDLAAKSTWDDMYTQDTAGWEQGDQSNTLREVAPQLKLPKSRICILGCGVGHDAAFFASQGHIVTAVDISSQAIERARKQYKESDNLKFVEADVFEWAENYKQAFDVVFEYRFFCAIDPDMRTKLVDVWRKLLAPGGHLLGIFFAFERMGGPPFGASEWEVRERLKKRFDFLYWTRWKTTIARYLGTELVVYAQKK